MSYQLRTQLTDQVHQRLADLRADRCQGLRATLVELIVDAHKARWPKGKHEHVEAAPLAQATHPEGQSYIDADGRECFRLINATPPHQPGEIKAPLANGQARDIVIYEGEDVPSDEEVARLQAEELARYDKPRTPEEQESLEAIMAELDFGD